MKKINMKVKIAFICLLSTLFLVACGSNDDGPVVVEFWTHYQHDLDFFIRKVEEYNEMNEGRVQINLTNISNDVWEQNLTLAFQNNQAPDIFADGLPVADFVQMGWLAPLNDLFSPEGWARISQYQIPGANTFAGNQYSAPFAGFNFRMVYNKELFRGAGLDPDNPPQSYAEVIEAARLITEYGSTLSTPAFGFMLPVGESWIWWQYGNQMANANGTPIFDYINVRFNFEAIQPVLEFYRQMYVDGSLFPGGLQMNNDPARAQFSAGNVGMMLAASWDVGVFNDQFPAVMEWGVAPLPTIEGVHRGRPEIAASTYLFINSASEVQREAAEFFEWILSPQFLAEYFMEGFGVPVYPDMWQYVTSEPDRPGLAAFADTSGDSPHLPEPSGFDLEGPTRDIIFSEIVAGNITDISAALSDLSARHNHAMQIAIDDGRIDPSYHHVPNFTPMNPLGQ